MPANFDALRRRLAQVQNVGKAAMVLGWDQSTYMPPGGAAGRGEQMATLAQLAHEIFVAGETGDLLDKSAAEVDSLGYDSDEASIVRVTRRDYDRQRRVPGDLVGRMRRHASESREVWVRARKENDFRAFAPNLRNTVNLSRELAEAYGFEKRPYDALVESVEPGITTDDLERIFGDLRRDQVPLIREIASRPQVDDSVLHQPFDEGKQEAFGKMVVQRFGYDFNRGRLDRTVHPFATSFGLGDVRITTRYDPKFLNMALFGTMHESGHGMYEQGIGPGLVGTPLARGASGGMHESQSRLWENLVGRSRRFWQAFLPELRKAFPEQTGSVEVDTLLKAVNKVHPSLIRVESDELTYNLHIIMRFELENDFLEGRLDVKDAPEAWRTKMNQYLGITPPDDTNGILQDIHWTGALGGFANYTLGNVIAAQLWEKAVVEKPGIPGEIEQGRFGTLLVWLQENVYQHGRKYQPNELVERVTGKQITTEPYIAYLKGKFSEIYGDLG
jgi:carboxypeptidase Taq